MDRRRFLHTLANGVIIAATPTYFLPPSGGWIQSAHPRYLIRKDWAFEVKGLDITVVYVALKSCWDAYRIKPTELYVTDYGIRLHEELRRANGL